MEKINIAELLKDCPKGMELDCVMYEGVTLIHILEGNAYPIIIETPNGQVSLNKYGQYSNNKLSKCVIFPKGKTTWEGFHRPFDDGDIVTWRYRGSLVAFIYKERINDVLVKQHFALYTCNIGTVINGEISLFESEIVFATEEEKQKLFDAIKANGYKWNAETKTLEKLIEPKFKVGDKIKHKENNGICCTLGEYSEGISAYRTNIGLALTSKDLEQWELAPNKFDINTLKPFDKVLVRDFDNGIWEIDFFSRLLDGKHFKCLDSSYVQCIPYEGNEHLLGTTNDCDEFYKTWEK